MIKAKLVAVFSAMLAVLAFSAAPAFAEFQSNSSETHGSGKSGPIVLEGGGATLECASAEGEWKIQTAGKIEEHEKGGKQEPATKGPQLYLPINKWNGCKAKSSSGTFTPTVGPCTLHLEQAAGETKAKGAVASECKVEIKILFITCKILVPQAKESGKVNFGLEKNELENSGSNLLTKAEDSGITSEAKNCPGVSSTTNAKEKGTVTGVGLKEV